jgi:hypothetical protein
MNANDRAILRITLAAAWGWFALITVAILTA